MRHRPRNPVGSLYRWRDGHARRPDRLVIEETERRLARAIGARLAEVLRAKDIATAELAAALNVTRFAVQHWIRGREMPSLRRLVTIAAALRCPLAELLPAEMLAQRLEELAA